MTILNLYQSFWEKLSEKIYHFWMPFLKNCPFHSEFIPVFLGKIVIKKLESIFGNLDLYQSILSEKSCGQKKKTTIFDQFQSFWEKLSFGTTIFGHSFIPVFLGKIVRKNLNAIFGHSEFIPVFLGKTVKKIKNYHFWPFWIYTSLFVKNCQKKIWNAIFGHSKFIPVFLGKIVRKNLECHFWPFWIYTSLFGKNCQKN